MQTVRAIALSNSIKENELRLREKKLEAAELRQKLDACLMVISMLEKDIAAETQDLKETRKNFGRNVQYEEWWKKESQRRSQLTEAEQTKEEEESLAAMQIGLKWLRQMEILIDDVKRFDHWVDYFNKDAGEYAKMDAGELEDIGMIRGDWSRKAEEARVALWATLKGVSSFMANRGEKLPRDCFSVMFEFIHKSQIALESHENWRPQGYIEEETTAGQPNINTATGMATAVPKIDVFPPEFVAAALENAGNAENRADSDQSLTGLCDGICKKCRLDMPWP